jgi:PHD/YefM family antitoxin component YafN of YafNO toxin-antitoxin module
MPRARSRLRSILRSILFAAARQRVLLTVNGQAEIVVQSADAYQKLLEAAEVSETVAGIRRGLEQAKRGEGVPMREFLEKFAKKQGVSLK